MNHGLAQPCRDKKTPVCNFKEELMTEAYCPLKRHKVFSLLPTFPLIIKL